MTRSTADKHQAKRAYQPPITSYFSKGQPDQSQPSGSIAAAASLLSEDDQASLLSVGMRIRKAVPEGYKTHQNPLFYDKTPARPALSPSTSHVNTMAPSQPRGLMPFCGIHKVGGLGVQDSMGAAYEGWLSSQESNASVQGDRGVEGSGAVMPSRNKRRMDDESDEDENMSLDTNFMRHDDLAARYPGRSFARARGRRHTGRRSQNMIFGIAEDDFEEATFLQHDEEMDEGGL